MFLNDQCLPNQKDGFVVSTLCAWGRNDEGRVQHDLPFMPLFYMLRTGVQIGPGIGGLALAACAAWSRVAFFSMNNTSG